MTNEQIKYNILNWESLDWKDEERLNFINYLASLSTTDLDMEFQEEINKFLSSVDVHSLTNSSYESTENNMDSLENLNLTANDEDILNQTFKEESINEVENTSQIEKRIEMEDKKKRKPLYTIVGFLTVLVLCVLVFVVVNSFSNNPNEKLDDNKIDDSKVEENIGDLDDGNIDISDDHLDNKENENIEVPDDNQIDNNSGNEPIISNPSDVETSNALSLTCNYSTYEEVFNANLEMIVTSSFDEFNDANEIKMETSYKFITEESYLEIKNLYSNRNQEELSGVESIIEFDDNNLIYKFITIQRPKEIPAENYNEEFPRNYEEMKKYLIDSGYVCNN